MVASAPMMVVVNPSVPASDMRELISLLKANPNKYNYASPGYGTSPHLASERLFKLTYGLDVVHVPFQGAAPAVQSVLSGITPIVHEVLPAVAPHIREGTPASACGSEQQAPQFFLDVPTLEEAGIPGHEVGFWSGILQPEGTPREIVELLQRQIAKTMALAEVKDRLVMMGFDPAVSTPEGFTAHMTAEFAKWSKVVREANIKTE
jgi:tripartite-type tricarboxylate transporter receptor subunit TctC